MGSVNNAYTNLILQTFEYLRPNKLDLSTAVVGMTLDGEVMTVPEVFSFDSFIGFENMVQFAKTGQIPDLDFVLTRYHTFGHTDIHSWDDIEDHGRAGRIFENTRNALIPYINEYTFDVFPVNHNNGHVESIVPIKADVDVKAIQLHLMHRRRTIPTNGVRVTFTDPAEGLQELLLKEILYDGSVVLLYKLSTRNGDLSGYYDNSLGFFFSPTIDMPDQALHNLLKAIVLYCYAANVLDASEYTDDGFAKHFSNFVFPIHAKSFGMGGKLRNMYRPEKDYVGTGKRKSDDRYGTRETSVNGYIRKLPDGQHASDEARERAKKLGYELALDRDLCGAVHQKSSFSAPRGGSVRITHA